eukprot:Hpha_TRINITY_DN16348_c0_g5::TRINITY_DN16348_c0_g5_i1::g.59333::m.59333
MGIPADRGLASKRGRPAAASRRGGAGVLSPVPHIEESSSEGGEPAAKRRRGTGGPGIVRGRGSSGTKDAPTPVPLQVCKHPRLSSGKSGTDAPTPVPLQVCKHPRLSSGKSGTPVPRLGFGVFTFRCDECDHEGTEGEKFLICTRGRCEYAICVDCSAKAKRERAEQRRLARTARVSEVLRGKWALEDGEQDNSGRLVFDFDSGSFSGGSCASSASSSETSRQSFQILQANGDPVPDAGACEVVVTDSATTLVESRGNGAYRCDYYLDRVGKAQVEGTWKVVKSTAYPRYRGQSRRFVLLRQAPVVPVDTRQFLTPYLGPSAGYVNRYGEPLQLVLGSTGQLFCALDGKPEPVIDASVSTEEGQLVLGFPDPWDRRAACLRWDDKSRRLLSILRRVFLSIEEVPRHPPPDCWLSVRAAAEASPLVLQRWTRRLDPGRDIEALENLERLGFPPHERWKRCNFEEAFRRAQNPLVGFGVFGEGGVLCGWAAGYVVRQKSVDQGTGYVQVVQTHPRLQRLGIAELVLRKLAQELLKEGAVRLMLTCRQQNRGAIRLYERLGFKAANQPRPGAFRRPCDSAVDLVCTELVRRH